MGVWYVLANFTKREVINFAWISGSKAAEIVGSPEAAGLTASYMLRNVGDDISFVPDDAPFRGELETDLNGFRDVTDQYVDELVGGVLIESGEEIIDAGDPLKGTPPIIRRVLRHWAVAQAATASGDGIKEKKAP